MQSVRTDRRLNRFMPQNYCFFLKYARKKAEKATFSAVKGQKSKVYGRFWAKSLHNSEKSSTFASDFVTYDKNKQKGYYNGKET